MIKPLVSYFRRLEELEVTNYIIAAFDDEIYESAFLHVRIYLPPSASLKKMI